jgi:hypothetical protein
VRSKTNWRTRRVTGDEDDYYPDCRTPPSQLHKSHTIDPDEFKTTSITSNGCNRLPDTGEVTTAPMNASIHGRNLASSETKWRTRRVADIEDDDHEYQTIPTSQLSAITSPSTYIGRCDLTPECRISRIKAKSDDLRVSKVTTTFLPIERSAPIPVCVYTYSSSNLEEAHLRRHGTTTYT